MKKLLELSKKKILVIGGTGFLGSNLVNKLVDLEANVTVLDDLLTGDMDNIDDIDAITFVKGSVTDSFLVNELVSKANIIFHTACRNNITSPIDPYDDIQVNVYGTYYVLLAAKIHKVEKVVYTSSASVYGNARYFPIHENEGLRPLSCYAASKLSAENYCTAFYETLELPVTILRYSNLYGIKDNPRKPDCSVVAKFFDCIKNRKPPNIHGDGEQTRDFTYIDDAVQATLLAALSPKTEGEIYNLGSGNETSINELAKKMLKISNNNLQPKNIEYNQTDNVRRSVLNIEKIRKSLHWSPSTSLDLGLEKTYKWINSNSFYGKIFS